MATVPESVRALVKAGFDIDDAVALRRAAMTLHRWFEEECNGTIQRDETTEIPYRVTPYGERWGLVNKYCRVQIADREKGARKRIASVVARYPGWVAYVQGDPRGAALYLIPPALAQRPGFTADAHYNSGIAVYK